MVGVRPVSRWMTHFGIWCSPVQHLTRMRASLYPKLKRDSSGKTSCSHRHANVHVDKPNVASCANGFYMRGILYKRILACSPLCRRRSRIVEVGNDSPEAVLQHSINCPDQVVWSVTSMPLRSLYHEVSNISSSSDLFLTRLFLLYPLLSHSHR